MGKLHFAFLV